MREVSTYLAVCPKHLYLLQLTSHKSTATRIGTPGILYIYVTRCYPVANARGPKGVELLCANKYVVFVSVESKTV